MSTTKEFTESLFQVVAGTPLNIAPERGQELAEDIFGSTKWDLVPSETEANFYAIPTDRAIYLSYAGLASVWCISYAAFHVSDIASRRQQALSESDQSVIDIGEEYTALKIPELLAFAKSLFGTDQDWPDGLPYPPASPQLSTPEGRVNNVFYGAISWILLHEIAHVHHGDTKYIPKDLLVRQEYRADDFATRWILKDAGEGLQREFRVLMIIVALTWLFLREQSVGIGYDHPATILRFREAAALFEVGDQSPGLENAAYVLKAVLDPTTKPPEFYSSKELFEWVASRLEAVFPPR